MITILCALVSSVLYRAGGLSKSQAYWIPVWMRHSWVRDWLCPIFILLPLFLIHPSWVFIPVYGLTGAALTTYWDRLFKYDNYYFSGFMLGLAAIPLIFAGFSWQFIIIRSLIIAITWGVISHISGNDHIEEHGRGSLAVLPSLLLT